MGGLETVVLVGVVLVAGGALARRVRLPAPVVLWSVASERASSRSWTTWRCRRSWFWSCSCRRSCTGSR
jgi:hypothetical protein